MGQTVAHYTITEKIGEGGMGEVYRAHDTKLNRDVALKILPQVFALDSQRMARFEREAQVLASLNHSNIAQIHGLEETEGTKALVLELVEGETLAEQISRGPIPVDEALKIALQIAEGLEAAHEKGIIHRDLKPANIKITPEGEVKILDFGLAKALEGEKPASELSHSPTISYMATQAGMILGTAAYMSPEQARGKPVDKRTDIWAFGCVLYEMLTGRGAFQGEDVTDLLASVLKVDPEWGLLRKGVSKEVRSLLRRCLTRDPKERLQAIGEARLTLKNALIEHRKSFFGDLPRGFRIAVWMIPMLLLVSLLSWWLIERYRPLVFESAQSAQRGILTPVQLTANPIDLSVTGAAISPDGNYLAYVDPEGLHLQLLSTGESHRVEINEPIRPWKVWWCPPDGTQLLLLARIEDENLSLWRVGMLGGRALRIQDDVMTAAISPDGRHLSFIRGATERDKTFREIWLADLDGQNPYLLLSAGPEESFWNLAWSPNSDRIAYGAWNNDASSGQPAISINSCDLEAKNKTLLLAAPELFQNWTGPLPFLWAPDGRLVFAAHERTNGERDSQTSNLWAVKTDIDAGVTTGDPYRLTQWMSSNVRGLSLSTDGLNLVAFLVRNQADLMLGKLDPSGWSIDELVRLTVNEKIDYHPSWRPDGKALVFSSSRGGTYDLYTVELNSSKPQPLLIAPGRQELPIYSPDGNWVIFNSPSGLQKVSENGGIPQLITDENPFWRSRCVQKDMETSCVASFKEGDEYVFHSFDPDREGSRELIRISHRAPFTNWALSPDGERIAVVHNDDSTVRLFSLPSGEESQVMVKGWTNFEFVDWSVDGNNLYLNAGFAAAGEWPSLIVVDLNGNARVLRGQISEWHIHPAVSPDGKHLAFVSMPFHGNAWLIKNF